MKKILNIGILAVMLLSPFSAYAQTAAQSSYVLLAPLPCVGTQSGTQCTNGTNSGSLITSIPIQSYLIYVFKLLIALAVFLSVIVAIYGGFKYMTTESINGKGDARKTIEDAVYGLLMALASYLILYTINPNFVNISKVAVPKLNVKTTNINLSGGLNDYSSVLGAVSRSADNTAIDANASAMSNASSASDNLDNINQELYDMGCIDEDGNDISDGNSNCQQLEAQAQDAQTALDTSQAQSIVQTAMAQMNYTEGNLNNPINVELPTGIIHHTFVNEADFKLSDEQDALQQITNIYSTAMDAIPNDDVDDRTQLTQQYIYSQASAINDYDTNSTIAALTYDAYVGTSDPNQSGSIADHIAAATTLMRHYEADLIPASVAGTLTPGNSFAQAYHTNNQTRLQALEKAIQAAQKYVQ